MHIDSALTANIEASHFISTPGLMRLFTPVLSLNNNRWAAEICPVEHGRTEFLEVN